MQRGGGHGRRRARQSTNRGRLMASPMTALGRTWETEVPAGSTILRRRKAGAPRATCARSSRLLHVPRTSRRACAGFSRPRRTRRTRRIFDKAFDVRASSHWLSGEDPEGRRHRGGDLAREPRRVLPRAPRERTPQGVSARRLPLRSYRAPAPASGPVALQQHRRLRAQRRRRLGLRGRAPARTIASRPRARPERPRARRPAGQRGRPVRCRRRRPPRRPPLPARTIAAPSPCEPALVELAEPRVRLGEEIVATPFASAIRSARE